MNPSEFLTLLWREKPARTLQIEDSPNEENASMSIAPDDAITRVRSGAC